jgi:transposase-like protein
MSGAQAPKYTQEQRAEVVRLVEEEGLSLRDAGRKVGMNDSAVSGIVSQWRRNNRHTRMVDGPAAAQVADFTARISLLVNERICILEEKAKKPAGVPLDELEKTTKVLKELSNLVKTHPGKTDESKEPTGKMAELASDLPDNGKAA